MCVWLFKFLRTSNKQVLSNHKYLLPYWRALLQNIFSLQKVLLDSARLGHISRALWPLTFDHAVPGEFLEKIFFLSAVVLIGHRDISEPIALQGSKSSNC